MRHSSAVQLTSLIGLGVCLVTTVLLAQKKPSTAPPRYNAQTEVTIKGTVQELKLPPKGSEKAIAYVLITSGADTLDAYLCPRSFLEQMGITYAKGDEVTLIGSKIKQGEADLILAREVEKGSDTLVLRDEKGEPVWAWRR